MNYRFNSLGIYVSDCPVTGTKRQETLAHQNRTIALASDFRVDGAKSPEIPQKEGVLGSEIATRNRKSLATFHRTLKSQCKVSEIASDFWGPRWALQSQVAKIAAIRYTEQETLGARKTNKQRKT